MINHRNAAFVQLLVTISIISVLFCLFIHKIQNLQIAAANRTVITNLHMINDALQIYEMNHGPIPPNTSAFKVLEDLKSKEYINQIPAAPFRGHFPLTFLQAEELMPHKDLQYSIQAAKHRESSSAYRAVLGGHTLEEWQDLLEAKQQLKPFAE